MSKEWFMAAHEQLIGEYMDAHPDSSESEAYDKTADAAHDRMVDLMSSAADDAHDRMKGDR